MAFRIVKERSRPNRVGFFCVYKDCPVLMIGIEEDSVRYAHSGPSQRFLRGFRPLVSVGPLPLPVYYNIDFAYVLTNDNLRVEGKRIYMPMYMLMFIQKSPAPVNQIFKFNLHNL